MELPEKEDVVVDGVRLVFVSGQLGGYYQKPGEKITHVPRTCVVCDSKIRWISAPDFAAYVCLKHDPPLIIHTPWCNNEWIERRELHPHEIDFMNEYS